MGETGSCYVGRAMLSKSLIQFSFDGWGCIPSLLFTWVQTMVEVMKIMVTSLKRSHACTATLSAPNPAAGHHRPTPLLETPRHPQASPGQSLVGSLLLSPGSFPVVQAGFRKGRRTRDQIASICWIKKAREFEKNIYFCFIDYTTAYDCVDHNKLWKILKDRNTRPPDLPLEKPVCRSGSNS